MKNNINIFFDKYSQILLEIYNSKLNLHTPIYMNNNTDPAIASNYINYQMTLVAEQINAKKVIDIGSGIGGSLIYLSNNSTQRNSELAQREDFKYYGLTSSEIETRESQNNYTNSACQDMCKCFAGDCEDEKYYKLFKNSDMFICFESLSYSKNLELVINNISKNIKDEGIFLVADFFDFDIKHDMISTVNSKDLEKITEENSFELLEKKDLSQFCKFNIKRNIFVDTISKIKNTYDPEIDNIKNIYRNIKENLKQGNVKYYFYKFRYKKTND